MTSLLEPSSVGLEPISLPPSSSLISPPPPNTTSPSPSPLLDTVSAANLGFHPTSDLCRTENLPPGLDGYISDSNTLNKAHSPYSYASYSPDMLGNSSSMGSPNDVMITSSGELLDDDLSLLLGLEGGVAGGSISADIKINVGQFCFQTPTPSIPAPPTSLSQLLSASLHLCSSSFPPTSLLPSPPLYLLSSLPSFS